jgi:hypothetical protein
MLSVSRPIEVVVLNDWVTETKVTPDRSNTSTSFEKSMPMVAACPPVVGYDSELQARVAADVEALPEGSAVADLLSDYAVMRDQAQACGG